MLGIISITRDDVEGIKRTINSTKEFRKVDKCVHLIIDSSSEGIAKEVSTLCIQEQSLHYYFQKAKGISAAFNLGIEKCDCSHLWFLNGGDYIHPSLEVDFFTNLLNRSTADVTIFQLLYEHSGVIIPFPPIWLRWPTFGAWVPHPSTIIRREVFEKYGSYDLRYRLVMDYDYWIKIFSKNIQVDFVSIPIAIFNEDGVSSKQLKNVARECLKSNFRNLFLILKVGIIRGLLILQDLGKMVKKSIL